VLASDGSSKAQKAEAGKTLGKDRAGCPTTTSADLPQQQVLSHARRCGNRERVDAWHIPDTTGTPGSWRQSRRRH